MKKSLKILIVVLVIVGLCVSVTPVMADNTNSEPSVWDNIWNSLMSFFGVDTAKSTPSAITLSASGSLLSAEGGINTPVVTTVNISPKHGSLNSSATLSMTGENYDTIQWFESVNNKEFYPINDGVKETISYTFDDEKSTTHYFMYQIRNRYGVAESSVITYTTGNNGELDSSEVYDGNLKYKKDMSDNQTRAYLKGLVSDKTLPQYIRAEMQAKCLGFSDELKYYEEADKTEMRIDEETGEIIDEGGDPIYDDAFVQRMYEKYGVHVDVSKLPNKTEGESLLKTYLTNYNTFAIAVPFFN